MFNFQFLNLNMLLIINHIIIYLINLYYSFSNKIIYNNIIPNEKILFFFKSNLLYNYLFCIYFINSGDI